MYILINKSNIYHNRNLKKINKKLGTDFKKEDFKNYNSNYILNVEDEDLDFKRDVHELNKVFVNKLYKKDNSNLITYGILVVMMIMILITMTSVSGLNAGVTEILNQLPKGAI